MTDLRILLDRLPLPAFWAGVLAIWALLLAANAAVLMVLWDEGLVPVVDHFGGTVATMPFGMAARAFVLAAMAWYFIRHGRLFPFVFSASMSTTTTVQEPRPMPTGAVPIPRTGQ